jgi:hypothetical protein
LQSDLEVHPVFDHIVAAGHSRPGEDNPADPLVEGNLGLAVNPTVRTISVTDQSPRECEKKDEHDRRHKAVGFDMEVVHIVAAVHMYFGVDTVFAVDSNAGPGNSGRMEAAVMVQVGMVMRHRTGSTVEENDRHREWDRIDRVVVEMTLDKMFVKDFGPAAPAGKICSWLRRSIKDPITCFPKFREPQRGEWYEGNREW